MDRLLTWFETYEANLDRVRAFWRGEGRYTISVYSTQHNYRQVFDGDVILKEAPRHLRAQAALPGLNLPSLYADWGTVSTAKYWGGPVRFDSTGMNIFVDPMAQTVDEALEMEPLPIDDPSMDAHFGIRLFREISEALRTEALWLRTPDMQGTLNTAGLVMNQEEMMIAMYTDGDKVHALLDKVCDFLIRYARYLRQETDGRVCGNIWPYTFFPAEIGVALTEDLMPLMSARLYKASLTSERYRTHWGACTFTAAETGGGTPRISGNPAWTSKQWSFIIPLPGSRSWRAWPTRPCSSPISSWIAKTSSRAWLNTTGILWGRPIRATDFGSPAPTTRPTCWLSPASMEIGGERS